MLSVNPSFLKIDWLYQCLLLALAATLGIFKACFESESIFDRFVIMFFVLCAIMFIVTTYFHKKEAQNFCGFVNRLILFEAGIFDNFSNNQYYKSECLYWTKDKTRMLVKHVAKLVTLALRSHSMLHELSYAIVPSVSWNLVPFAIFNYPSTNFDTFPLQMFAQLTKRVVLFFYLYVTLRVFTNCVTINMVINMLIPTFCLSASLKVLKAK